MIGSVIAFVFRQSYLNRSISGYCSVSCCTCVMHTSKSQGAIWKSWRPGRLISFTWKSVTKLSCTRWRFVLLWSFRAELAYDSDASSVCSINTSPGDLSGRTNPQHRPKMPTFSDEKGIMSDVPKSSFNRNEQHKPHKPVDSIRRRPPGVFGPYQLCWQNKRKQGCDKGKTCLFAHSEKERKAWEEDRKKGTIREKAINFSLWRQL